MRPMGYVNRQGALLTYAKAAFVLLLALMIIISYTPLAAYSGAERQGAVYYVSTTGNDGNPGTIEWPWRTIQKAADTLRGGETALVRGGVYGEFVSVNVSGSEPEGYVTLQAYPGEQPIIDGTKLAIASGRSALIEIRNSNYVVIDGFEVRNLSSSSNSEYPAGIRVKNGGSNIHILNNNVHQIRNTNADGNAHGIHIYGNTQLPLRNVEISGNRVHHLTLGSSESLTLSGNIDGFAVENNIVHDNNNIGIDIAGFYGACSSPCQDQARNGKVAGNTVFNIDSSINPAYEGGSNSAGGIYADGAANVVIERNQVYGSGFGIELASENEGKTTSGITVRNNYLHHNDGAGIMMGGSESTNGGASGNTLANNTLIQNDQLQQGYGEITLQENTKNNRILNNLIFALPGKSMVYKSNTSGSGNVIDYNLYYWTDGKQADWEWEEEEYASWDEYRASTGYDANSRIADPLLTDMGGNDIKLSERSPAIDKGTVVSGIASSMDYYGMARIAGAVVDIGASEYGGESAQPLPEPSTPASPSPTPAPTPTSTQAPSETPPTSPLETAPPKGDFLPDGHVDDWNGIEAIATGTSNVRSMRASLTDQELRILITGNLLHEKGQLFIDTDGKGESGFQAPYWNGLGADYLLENGVLYRYSGKGGTNWGWTEVRSYRSSGPFTRNSTTVEAAIPLSDLGVEKLSAISIGYVWKDSHENKLPSTNAPAVIFMGEATLPHPATPDIRVDGDMREWTGLSYVASGRGSPKGVKLWNDEEHLYVLAEGNDLDKAKVQVYFSSSCLEGTAFATTRWSSGKANMLLENGRLYRYSGKGTDWAWTNAGNLKKSGRYAATKDVIEAAIPLSSIGGRSGTVVKVGVLLNDDKETQLPTNGDMISYIVQ